MEGPPMTTRPESARTAVDRLCRSAPDAGVELTTDATILAALLAISDQLDHIADITQRDLPWLS